MPSRVHTAITHEESGETNSGFVNADKVTNLRKQGQPGQPDVLCVITLEGKGPLRRIQLQLRPDLARAMAQAILLVERPPASELSFNL